MNQYNEAGGLAPFAPDIEEAVLGSVISNEAAYFAVASILTGEDFFLLRHQRIWKAVTRIMERSEALDYLILSKELQDLGWLDEIGGPPYLLRLVTNTPTSVNAEDYARIVERAAIRRRLLAAADEIKALAINEELPTDKVVEEAESRVYAVAEGQRKSYVMTLAEALDDVYEEISAMAQMRAEGKFSYPGLETGLRDWDRILAGLAKGQLHFVGARPGMGKSSLVLQTAINTAQRKREDGTPCRVFYWSGEMDARMLAYRVAAIESSLSVHNLRRADLREGDGHKLIQAIDVGRKWDITIDYTKSITAAALRASIKRAARHKGFDLIIIDYIGLMTPVEKFQRTENQELGEIAKRLIDIAQEYDCPVLSAVQLSRKLESRADKRPQLSDLRDSGNLEQDAYSVTFIYRDAVYNEDTEYPNQAELIVAKNRNGPTDTAFVYWRAAQTGFADLSTQHIDLGAFTSEE